MCWEYRFPGSARQHSCPELSAGPLEEQGYGVEGSC